MISKTGKVARYYETQYYFKEAYLNWKYRSIPFYEEVLPVKFTGMNQFNYTNTITTKGTNECDQINKYVQQYTTEEGWRNQKVYIRIKASTQVLLLRQFTFYLFKHGNINKSFNDQFPVDETVELNFADRVKFGETVFLQFKNRRQPSYQLICQITDVVPKDGILGLDFVTNITNKVKFTHGRVYTNTISHQAHRSLITLGTAVTDIEVSITSFTLSNQNTPHVATALNNITNNISQRRHRGLVLARKHITDLMVKVDNVTNNFSYTNSINLQSYTNTGG